MTGRLVPVLDTRLFVEERGEGFPVIVLHGGPGLDHHEFADYLDPLTDRYRLALVDQRSQGRSDLAAAHTWTIHNLSEDVVHVARALEYDRYAVLGHSFGGFVALQNAVDFPGAAAGTIVSGGVPSMKLLDGIDRALRTFGPEALRGQVTAAWERERTAESHDDVASLLHDQLPFHFADPLDPRIAEYEARAAGARYTPAVLRAFGEGPSGAIEVEDRLDGIAQPVLVIAGRHDRICPVEAAEVMAHLIPDAELAVMERSGHMPFVEQQDRYVEAVRSFLDRRVATAPR